MRALAAPYAALLGRRFSALEAAARGERVTAAALALDRNQRSLSRRVLRRLEARWHDGDENLVRGTLDRWTQREAPAPAETAARLLEAAGELARIGARPQAWWFFLWEMESLLALVAGGGGC